MNKKILSIILASSLLAACDDDAFLNRPPTKILTVDQVWNSETQILAVLGDLYNRQVDIGNIKSWTTVSDFNEAFWSNAGSYGSFQNTGWANSSWALWDYGYIREINLFIENCEKATALKDDVKARFLAEARFLRASIYFQLVQRMGGVPLILQTMTYDFSGDPSYLRVPRSKESEVYDFILRELDEIKSSLPNNINEKSRATQGAVLAMQSRVALYAASIAKYGSKTPQVALNGGEVGIPANMADGYYTKSLAAARELLSGSAGAYALYNKKPDLAENFASLFYDKSNNNEVIYVEDFKLRSGKVHNYTIQNQPRYGAEEEEGGRINPSLNLVQSFETLDNKFEPLKIADAAGNPIYYDNLLDVFANRDARLAGTVILPGSSFKGRPVDIWAGYQLADGTIFTGTDRGQQRVLPGKTLPEQVVGFDGPIDGFEFTAQTGFYVRKYLDPVAGSGQRGVQSEVWYIRYRLGEVLLNAAEASFELGQLADAAAYLNTVRERAGLTIPLEASDVTFDRIVSERRAELSFEGHTLMDYRRWRIGHEIQDGVAITPTDLVQDIGKATKRNTQPYALWPYKIYNPGGANDGKWIFKIVRLSRVTTADRFEMGNYYSYIPDDVINNNPLIVRNPNH